MSGDTIFIVGTGAQATALAFEIQRDRLAVRLLDRSGSVNFRRELRDAEGRLHSVAAPPASNDDFERAALVLFAVKAYQLESALEENQNRFLPQVPFVSLANGAIESILQKFSRRYPHRPCRLGLSTVAVSDGEAGEFEINSGRNGYFGWGAYSPENASPTFVERRLFGGKTFRWLERPQLAHRKKWLFNTTLNGVVAAHDLKCNGDALSDLAYLESVFDEAYRLGERLWGNWSETEESLYGQLLTLIDQTRTNENSMMRDRRRGRPTEIAYLAGLSKVYSDLPLLNAISKVVN